MLRRGGGLSARVVVTVTVVITAVWQFVPTPASAAIFQSAFLRLDRIKAATASGGLVCAKTPVAESGVEGKVVITFPADFTLDETAGHWVVDTSAAALSGTAGTAWVGPPAATAVVDATHTATFSSGNLTANTLYCFAFTAGITSVGAAGNNKQASIQTQTGAAAPLDTTQVAVSVVADDEITINAVVPPMFQLTLEGNADSFGNLDPAQVVSTTGKYAEVSTNAKGGWIAWARSSNQGLTSANAGHTIATVGTYNSGNAANGVPDGAPSSYGSGDWVSGEGYVMDVDTIVHGSGCTVSIAGEYNGADTDSGGSMMGNYQPVATCTGVNPNQTSDQKRINFVERAEITYATPASSDYGDIITVVGAGNF